MTTSLERFLKEEAMRKEGKLKVKAPPVPAATHEDKQRAAYYRWLERGGPRGDDWNDWFEIENKWGDNIVPRNND